MANLANPNYVIESEWLDVCGTREVEADCTEGWHTVLLAYLIALMAMFSNIFLAKFLDRISRTILIWNICSFVVVIVSLLATNDNKQSASFVFSDFQNFTGFGASYTAVLGIVQSAFGM
jgi:amino acid transporter